MSAVRKNEVFPIDKSPLHFNLQCLTVLGVWNPYESGLKYWVYGAYWAFVMYFLLAMEITTTLVRGITAENSIQFLEHFSKLAIQIADTITYLAFLLHRLDVLKLSNAFNWERHILGTDEITQYRNRILTDALSSCKKFSVIITVAVIQYFAFSFYNIFVEADYHVERLNIGTAPWKYHFRVKNFWVAFVCDFLTSTFLGLFAALHDAFIMAIMVNIKAQLKILNFRMERCHMTSFEVDKGGRDDGNSRIIFFECVEREIKDKSRSLDPTEELINCVKIHQQILRIVNLFRKIYSAALLPHLLISVVLITVLLLQIVLGKENNHAAAVVALGFLVPVLFQLLTFCWGGNIVMVESDKSSNALYGSHWYDRNKEFRKIFEIFLGALRKPLIISASGLCDLTTVTFKNVLSKAYSGVAVLNNMSN